MPGHDGGVWYPAAQGAVASLAWRRLRWSALAALAVAARRPRFAGAAAGIDWEAAERALRQPGLSITRRAATLSAMAGDSVTATRASHWRDVSRACPRCAAPEETVEHQLWLCPRWCRVRQEAASPFGVDAVLLPRALPPLTLHALLRSPCPELLASAAAVARAPNWWPSPGLLSGPPESAWADGSATRAALPGLAREIGRAHV